MRTHRWRYEVMLAGAAAGIAMAGAVITSQAEDNAPLLHVAQLDVYEVVAENDGSQAAPIQPAKARVSATKGHSMGSENAPVTLVGFSDYQCPFCRRFHETVFEALKENYIDTGKLRYISRDLPLPIHKYAIHAALAAHCAGDQNKYWQVHDVLLSNGDMLNDATIRAYAAEQNLDMHRFESCLDSAKHLKKVESSFREAVAIGLTGTPSFVLGKTDSRWIDGSIIVGIQTYEAFEDKIEELLSATKK